MPTKHPRRFRRARDNRTGNRIWRRNLRILRNIILAASLPGALAACSHTPQPTTASIYNPETNGLPPQQAGGSGSLFTFGGGSKSSAAGTGIQVNAYLWRATLDTLSFMPLVSADPFGGVIITDWYSPPGTPGERFKANAYILSQQMSANAVQVSVFHQIQQGGQWTDAPADPSTASGLEDRILAHAADLQAEANNTR
jgi:hypothetical protein